MKKLLITIPFLLLAAACNNQQAQVRPVQNQSAWTSPSVQVEQQQPQATSTDESANWKTYSDDQHGFEFQYLQNNNSFVAADGRPTGLIFSLEKDGVEALSANFEHKDAPVKTSCLKGTTNIGNITIAGILVDKCFDKTLPAWDTILQKKVSNGVDFFTISCSNEHSDFEPYCEKVLSTFKFTK